MPFLSKTLPLHEIKIILRKTAQTHTKRKIVVIFPHAY